MSAGADGGFRGFEGSFLGDASRIADATRMECKICWTVYDPALGCADWQIPAGTPFSALPSHWRCPNCDAEKSGFMALDTGIAPKTAEAPPATVIPVPVLATDPDDDHARARRIAARFETAFRDAHLGKMRDVPFLNKALSVQAIGFRPHGREVLGVMLTPWFMNLVLVPLDPPASAPEVGSKDVVEFPSGRYEFIWADRLETGPYRACSLFSPVFDFNSQLSAIEVAQAVLVALFEGEHRDEGTRAAEIRSTRAAELAAAPRAETDADEDRPAIAIETVPTRRALLTGNLRKEASA
ncbi:MAG: [NiFe]-hydrogenase assembly chaperone HybE [Hyphomicrobiaceae bacterium]|nr:[NiFe]-hydrogenase assembly chaperone HybE [Hyphomicrobiaceae bacterium]